MESVRIRRENDWFTVPSVEPRTRMMRQSVQNAVQHCKVPALREDAAQMTTVLDPAKAVAWRTSASGFLMEEP
jgi:hypothetical protein